MTMFALPAEVTPTPTPSGVPFDPTTVTPGWVGFAITLLVMIATLLLILDMVRRVRRVRYRGEIRERLEAEQVGADQAERPKDDPTV